MSFWDKVKKNAQKTKLRGEVLLLERQATGRKKTFGIELYDLLTNDKNKLLGLSAGTIFKGEQQELKAAFELCRDEIFGIQAKKDVKQKELDVMEVKGAHTLPDVTMGQKMNKTGRAISNGAKGTKIRAEMVLLDRDMKIRKEEFGLEVFDHVEASDSSKPKNAVQKVTNALSNLSQPEKDIQACIDKVKGDVADIDDNIHSKQVEMNSLDEEMQPMVP